MSREVREERCASCRLEVLVGMSDDDCAHKATVARTPLNPYGEMVARLWRLRTYDLHRELDGFRLYLRDHWQIAGRPASHLVYCWRVDVLPEHRCGLVLPSTQSLFQTQLAGRPDPLGPPPF